VAELLISYDGAPPLYNGQPPRTQR
jgi:hypothetical protein